MAVTKDGLDDCRDGETTLILNNFVPFSFGFSSICMLAIRHSDV